MTLLDRRLATAGLASLLLPATANAQTKPEKASVKLGVGGKPLLYYLPLTIAERKGYFKDEGLDVEINDFGSGARSLQALIGGSIDVVTGAYEHTIRMQAKSQDVRAVIELGRFPGVVIAVAKSKVNEVKSMAGAKGLKIGVTAPGSSTALIAQYAMVKAGLKANDAALIGIGGGSGAVAAVKQGQVDLISHLDPVIAKLEADGDVVTLIDTRTEAGTRALFGGSNPAAVMYTMGDFIQKNPETTQRLVNALFKSLKWLATATPDAVADAVPTEYHLNDKPLYMQSVKAGLDVYSRTGIVAREGMESVLDMLKTLDPEMAKASVDLSATFVDRFVKKASGQS